MDDCQSDDVEVVQRWERENKERLAKINVAQSNVTEVVREAMALDRGDIGEQLRQRAEDIRQELLKYHLPRIPEALQVGYADPTQALAVYDHLIQIRILKETAALIDPNGTD